MALAIFDLDNTLIGGDSDYLWGKYLGEIGVVDPAVQESENQRFYDDYNAGRLDIMAWLAFQLAPLARHEMEQLKQWREKFVREKIGPILLPKADELIESHRANGDTLLIITATNRFTTEPIADLLGIEHLIATEPEIIDGQFTGGVSGVPSFAEGKLTRLQTWLDAHEESMQGSTFYSDSHNDLPLLRAVDTPVVVDGDAPLLQEAARLGWKAISLR